MKGLLGKIRVCWDRAVQVLTKINERFWNFDEWILKSQLGVYAYFITIAVTIGVLASWVIMGQGVRVWAGGWVVRHGKEARLVMSHYVLSSVID